jgi:hypothetical protein
MPATEPRLPCGTRFHSAAPFSLKLWRKLFALVTVMSRVTSSMPPGALRLSSGTGAIDSIIAFSTMSSSVRCAQSRILSLSFRSCSASGSVKSKLMFVPPDCDSRNFSRMVSR